MNFAMQRDDVHTCHVLFITVDLIPELLLCNMTLTLEESIHELCYAMRRRSYLSCFVHHRRFDTGTFIMQHDVDT